MRQQALLRRVLETASERVLRRFLAVGFRILRRFLAVDLGF